MKLEWLILGDYAEVVGGKLYLMGGGWDVLSPPHLPFHQQIGVAASFQVGWNETNERHNVEIEIQDENKESLAKIVGVMEVGRPPGIARGQDQRAQVAGSFPLEIKALGRITITARIEGEEQGQSVFSVVAGPMFKETAPSDS